MLLYCFIVSLSLLTLLAYILMVSKKVIYELSYYACNRQHWFISRLDGASITAGGFPQWNNNVLVVTTSSNQIYAFDIEAKQLGDWSMRHTQALPKRFQEFPGEVIGLSFPPSTTSLPVIVYSSRYCSISLFYALK